MCQQKLKTFVQESHFTKIYKEPTGVYQKWIQQQYTIHRDMRCVLRFSWTRSHWILYCQRCVYTQSRKYKQLGTTEEAHYCMVLLLQDYGLVHVNFCNFKILRLLILMMKVGATGTWSACWTYDPLFLVNPVKMAPWCWNL